MEILSYLRKTLKKMSTKGDLIESSICGKCCTSPKQMRIKFCKCCGKNIVAKTARKSAVVVKTPVCVERSTNFSRVVKLTQTTRRRTTKNVGSVIAADLLAAKRAYRMKNYYINNCQRNVIVNQLLPSTVTVREHQKVQNQVRVKQPKTGLKRSLLPDEIDFRMKPKRRQHTNILSGLKKRRNQKSTLTFFVDVASTPIKSAPVTSTPVKNK